MVNALNCLAKIENSLAKDFLKGQWEFFSGGLCWRVSLLDEVFGTNFEASNYLGWKELKKSFV